MGYSSTNSCEPMEKAALRVLTLGAEKALRGRRAGAGVWTTGMEIHGNVKGHGNASGAPVLSAVALYQMSFCLSFFKFSHSEIAILGQVSQSKIKCHYVVPCSGVC